MGGVKRCILCVWKGFSFSWAKDVINVSVCGGGWWLEGWVGCCVVCVGAGDGW